jgi:hypothetical protein
MNEGKRVPIFFEDMSINSSYELLEEGKNDSELQKIATKRGLKIPCKDLAVFKCSYAMVDEENKNKCTLPRKEVKKALDSLTGKAVDKDHLRKSVFGTWLDAELEGDTIIAYGSFWKSNFPDEYEEIKKRIKEGKLKISFEAWGNRIFKENGGYDLTDVEFAGGALLFDTEPAFPDAEVLEFSQYQGKTLEFAKITEEKENIGGMEENREIKEEAKYDFYYDKETLGRILQETECPSCKMKGWHDVQSIDFVDSKITTRCPACQGINIYDLNPSASIVKKGKKPEKASFEDYEDTEEKIEMSYAYQLEGSDFIDEDGNKIEGAKKLSYAERIGLTDDNFAAIVIVESKKDKKQKKIRTLPIHDECNVKNSLSRLSKAEETLKKLGVSVDLVKANILKKAKELKMTELLNRHKEGGTEVNELLVKHNKASVEELGKFIDETLASVTAKDVELASVKQELADSKIKIENSNLELERIKVEMAAIKTDLDVRITAEKASLIKARRDELDEDLNKAMTDEDILNELKFENAKLKKLLKNAKIEVPVKASLEAGKQVTLKDNSVFSSQKSVQELAFPK